VARFFHLGSRALRRDITIKPIPPPGKVIMKPGMCNKRSSSKEPVASVAGNNHPHMKPTPLSHQQSEAHQAPSARMHPEVEPYCVGDQERPEKEEIHILDPAAGSRCQRADRMLRKAVIFSELCIRATTAKMMGPARASAESTERRSTDWAEPTPTALRRLLICSPFALGSSGGQSLCAPSSQRYASSLRLLYQDAHPPFGVYLLLLGSYKRVIAARVHCGPQRAREGSPHRAVVDGDLPIGPDGS
jgi:hypothetical protein